ncbi:MAG TPA: BrnT family toxin [Myxococcota bacterium]|nr:BrnT family toxin [Myxococcota bacterium]
MLRFEWDDAKADQNKRKHRVSFEEAQTVFYDERGVLVEDEDEEDDRFVLIGLSATLRVLVVSHCYRAKDQVIRLISARKATASERKDYERRWKR